ncbi:MAG: MTH938/NDUFAF3 family protein [Candidatus Aenigmatarchaeota archaeon]|nr:hypothetical protein [Candidatus Aenigmarchaeota archaeon]
MKIDSFYFGTIIIGGKKFTTDIKIYPDGKIVEKEKSHEITKFDVDDFLMENVEIIIIGNGTAGAVKIDPSVHVAAQVSGIELIIKPTPQAVQEFNKIRGKKVGAIFHLTC